MATQSSRSFLVFGLGLGLGLGLGACGDGGSGDSTCAVGSAGCECLGNACAGGLQCVAGYCIAGGGETGDGDGDPGDGDTDTGDGDCEGGQEWCTGKCVSVDQHPLHCGACNNPCGDGEVCVGGMCEFIADCTETPCPGFSYCDLADKNCKPGCATDDLCNANELCDVGTHECVCDEGFKLCEGACVNEDTPCATQCGNGIIDGGEVCDGNLIGNQSCISQGWDDGNLACAADCMDFDFSGCVSFDCDSDHFFSFTAADAELQNWDLVPSQLEPNQVAQWTVGEVNYVRFHVEIPCTDTWHVWIRAIDYQYQDWYGVRVDNYPASGTKYYHSDLACSSAPASPEYKWTELNLSASDPFCTYEENPWVQDWEPGPHTFRLSGSEGSGYAVSQAWVTNTNMTPP